MVSSPARVLYSPGGSRDWVALAWGSASMSSTRWPYSVARMAATLTAVTVFPTPPFRFTMAIVFTFIVLSLV